jgi:ABC-2 type transport system ATP-binding protein
MSTSSRFPSTGIAASALTKVYGRTKVVDGLTFECRPGTVTGFLGPNGSGKSTTLRMLVGFTQPTVGVGTIDGLRYVDVPNPGLRVGVLLDPSAQHDGRSARETVVLAALTMSLPVARAHEALEFVGLAGVAKRRVGALSLGMRQRLGLAIAMLGRPAHLILDEPFNGLDPEGIRWLRELVRDVANRGGAVLLSSHLLREVQAVADHIVMIDRGRCVASGPMTDFSGAVGVRVECEDLQGLAAALMAAGFAVTAATDGAGLNVAGSGADVGRVAQQEGLVLTQLTDANADKLEEIFLSSTSGEFQAAPAVDLGTEPASKLVSR